MSAFAPHPSLAPFANQAGGMFFFDSSQGSQSIVLIHGNGDEADTWRHLFLPLAKQYRVIAPDLPGFGRSQTQESSIQGFARSLLGLLDELQLPTVHLVGSSLGAVVAASLASTAPTRVQSLCLIGGAAPTLGGLQVTPAIAPLLEFGRGEAYYNGLRQAGQDAAFATLKPYYHDLEALPKTDLEFLHQRVWERVQSDTQRDAFFAALRSLFAPIPLELAMPTQLIWGETDQIIPISHAQQMLIEVPQARLEVVAKAGHLPHQEQPETTLAILLPFLTP